MAGKKVWRDTVFSVDGLRISKGANSVSIPLSRVEVDSAMFEDLGDATEKGSYTNAIGIDGALGMMEKGLLIGLQDRQQVVPFISFRDSSALSLVAGGPPGPVVAQGTPCMFMDCKVTGVDVNIMKNQLRGFKAKLRSAGSYLFVGQVFYTNVGDAALTPGPAVVTVPIVLTQELAAGFMMGVCVAAVDPPGVPGTTPSCAVRLLHDVDVTFATPLSAYTFAPFTKPSGQMVVLDGDVTPLPGELAWALEFTVTGTAGAQFTFMAGIDIVPKEA